MIFDWQCGRSFQIAGQAYFWLYFAHARTDVCEKLPQFLFLSLCLFSFYFFLSLSLSLSFSFSLSPCLSPSLSLFLSVHLPLCLSLSPYFSLSVFLSFFLSLSLSLSHTHTHIAFIISQKIRFKDSKKDQLTLLARECIMSPSAGSAWGGVAVHFASRFLFEHISYDSATMSHMNTTSTTHAQPGSCWKRHWHMHGPPASLCRCFLFKQFRGIHKSQVCSIQISYVYILPTDIRQQNAHVICWKHASFVKLLHPEAESACVKATNSHTVLYNF